MATREEYIEKLEGKLKEWNKQVQILENRAKGESQEFRNMIDEKIAELKIKRQQLELQVVKIRNAGDDTLAKVRIEADNLWNKFKEGLEKLKNSMTKEMEF